MPITELGLKASLKAELEDAFEYQIPDQLDKLCEAVANAVCSELRKATISVTGVATCSTGGGPVTGTGTLT